MTADLKLAVFDCDGTLVDSQYMIVAAMEQAFAHHGRTLVDPRKVRRVVGLSLPEAVARLMPGEDPALILAISDSYKAAYGDLRARGGQEPLYPGAREAILDLAGTGYLLGVATGKSRRGLVAVLEQHDLHSCFVTLQTADDAPGKPHPAMLEQAMAAAGVSAAETIMIGDTSYDMMMARAAGAAALGVAWGYHDRAELRAAGAATVIEDCPALPPAVRQLLPLAAEAES